MRLSKFTESLNSAFGSNVAIPNGPDFGYLRKILGDNFQDTIKSFKGSHDIISRLAPVSFTNGEMHDGQRLHLINIQDKGEGAQNGIVEFKNDNLPSTKFTKIENDSFSLFHELGHTLDADLRFPKIENLPENVNLYWMRENFADFFATIMLIKATGGDQIIENRLLPHRALSKNFEYQTTMAIEWGRDFCKKNDIMSASEKDIVTMLKHQWNTEIAHKASDMHKQAENNIIARKILCHCLDAGGTGALLEHFDRSHHPKIIEHLSAFNTKYIRLIAANVYSFAHPGKNLTKIQLTIAQPLDSLIRGLKKEHSFDHNLLKYMSKFPENPISKISEDRHLQSSRVY